jgi:TrpR-related protein YerC/YecD
MAKFSPRSKLPYKETQQMIIDLCAAIASMKNSKEAAQLLTDLLGRQEIEMIAKRLKVADLLLNDNTYETITGVLKVSPPTIARVHAWLQESGGGYRLALERTTTKREELSKADEPIKLSSIKRKYPLYYWPQIMLEQMVKNSTKKEKQQLKGILDKLGTKRQLYTDLDRLL